MSNRASEVAKGYWQSLINYPPYPFLKERRFYEIQYVLRFIPTHARSLLDLGCGDGSALLLLRELSPIEKLFGIDLSAPLIEIARAKLGATATLEVADFSKLERIPQADITLSLGVLPYIFDDHLVRKYFSLVKSSRFILRTPCNIEKSVEINKYSEDLGAQYAAIYRTPEEVQNLLKTDFEIVAIDRAYPDEIESKYGTKHFFFVCDPHK